MGRTSPLGNRTGAISATRSVARRLVAAVSLRVRLTVVLALGIAVVLTGGWLLLYRDLGAELSAVITSELEIRVADVVGAGDTVVPNDDVAAQVVDLDNRVIAPPGADPILTADELADARRSPILVDRAVPAVAEHARVLARRHGDRLVVAAASTESVERAPAAPRRPRHRRAGRDHDHRGRGMVPHGRRAAPGAADDPPGGDDVADRAARTAAATSRRR